MWPALQLRIWNKLCSFQPLHFWRTYSKKKISILTLVLNSFRMVESLNLFFRETVTRSYSPFCFPNSVPDNWDMPIFPLVPLHYAVWWDQNRDQSKAAVCRMVLLILPMIPRRFWMHWRALWLRLLLHLQKFIKIKKYILITHSRIIINRRKKYPSFRYNYIYVHVLLRPFCPKFHFPLKLVYT